jgi:hypothetical protein
LRQKIREAKPELQEDMNQALVKKESRKRVFQIAARSSQPEAIDPINIPENLTVIIKHLKI